MFKSATLKLTGWYLLILMAISVLFSGAIYGVARGEVSLRLEGFEHTLQIDTSSLQQSIDVLRANQINAASQNIIASLFITNLVVLTIGGALSYLLARLTLRPIKEMHEAQSRFTSDASHELRTPLAAMKTEIEVALHDKSATKKDYEIVLRSNIEEVDKLTTLSQMLLNLSRLNNEKLKSTAVNIKAVTYDIIRRRNISPDRIRIKSSQKPIVHANEPAIVELVSILVDNALKYSPADSLVLINLSIRGTNICFEIINSGDGINEKKLPYIFDRFYRADTSRTTREGYGLGLSLAKKIVELSNGELSVTSTPGQSTIFTVLLPISWPRSRKNSTAGRPNKTNS